ncbi:DUF4878 domain-containing protein [Thermoleophilia bacterium SCSIO 60948]|nr:DUF4878 domain-containing protein [Thermoleophilia bacterium SCSIO 60948]
MDRKLRTAVLTALAAFSVILAACGGEDPGDPVDTVERIFAATVNGDGETACSVATEEAQQNLIESSGQKGASCEEAVDALAETYPEDFAISDPEVLESDDESATVRVTLSGGGSEQEDEVALVVEDGEWKVSGDAE